jgi:hypothetical protein
VHASILKYFVSGALRFDPKAAQNLFVASSAINQQIRKLEEELGTIVRPPAQRHAAQCRRRARAAARARHAA